VSSSSRPAAAAPRSHAWWWCGFARLSRRSRLAGGGAGAATALRAAGGRRGWRSPACGSVHARRVAARTGRHQKKGGSLLHGPRHATTMRPIASSSSASASAAAGRVGFLATVQAKIQYISPAVRHQLTE